MKNYKEKLLNIIQNKSCDLFCSRCPLFGKFNFSTSPSAIDTYGAAIDTYGGISNINMCHYFDSNKQVVVLHNIVFEKARTIFIDKYGESELFELLL